ncbi:hypothetical protein SISNIDRAFT_455326 [Sistotremastrum niveocremeum HHB9708]|uniref:Uncharacterized protein n=1 Tax=Sistotremastrum niveocremeum HHB9708 TaxID=1314777 RepID=A0A164TXM0_9AGAM|nr:hypothetical protein SISNIDRAFT_455326 [Sistotremastrum niveocremeum HHB9708]
MYPFGPRHPMKRPVIPHDCILKMHDVPVFTLVHISIFLSTPRMQGPITSAINMIVLDRSTKFLALGPMISAVGLVLYAMTVPTPSVPASQDHTTIPYLLLKVVLPFILASSGVEIALIGLSLRILALSCDRVAISIIAIVLASSALWIFGAIRSVMRQYRTSEN